MAAWWQNPATSQVQGVCMGFFWVLQCPPTSQKHADSWIGYAKLPLDANE